jgi:hypothetical protein
LADRVEVARVAKRIALVSLLCIVILQNRAPVFVR